MRRIMSMVTVALLMAAILVAAMASSAAATEPVVEEHHSERTVVLADLELRATVRGEDRSGGFAVTDVWVKRDGRWQVVARSSIFVPRASGA